MARREGILDLDRYRSADGADPLADDPAAPVPAGGRQPAIVPAAA